jgi:N utilization substance protein A
VEAFSRIPNVPNELPENLVAQGFFTFDDLSIIEPEHLAELGGGLTTEQCDEIIAFADEEALRLEEQTKLEKQQREERRMAQSEEENDKHPRRRFTTLPVSAEQAEAEQAEGGVVAEPEAVEESSEPAKSEGEPPVEDHSVEVGSEAQAAEVQGESQAE